MAQQVELLRLGGATGLDVDHLIEELEGLTKRVERALGSQLKCIMTHMLKQRHQPARATRSWEESIENGREEITDILEPSPSLRRSLPKLMAKKLSARRQSGGEGHAFVQSDLARRSSL